MSILKVGTKVSVTVFGGSGLAAALLFTSRVSASAAWLQRGRVWSKFLVVPLQLFQVCFIKYIYMFLYLWEIRLGFFKTGF